MKRAIFLLTQHFELGSSGLQTGVWADELTTPYYALADSGIEVHFATLEGGRARFEPRSIKSNGDNGGTVDRFLSDAGAMQAIGKTGKVSRLQIDDFSALVIPGGHGALWDIGMSIEIGRFVLQALTQDRIVAAACHGPAALLLANSSDGIPSVRGRKMTCFCNAEEEVLGLENVVPYLLENRLRALGADLVFEGAFSPSAVRDRNLITCQNAQSTRQLTSLLLQALNAK